MKTKRIRPLAICLFRHNGRILVDEGYDSLKQQHFYRPLGGGIHFGEYSRDAVVREIREELNVRVTNLRYLGTLENMFVFNGEPGHEIVQVYDGQFADRRLYEQAEIQGFEDNVGPFVATWRTIDFFRGPTAPPLHPDGLLDLLLREQR